MQRGFAPIIILVGILILAGVAGGGYYVYKTKVPGEKSCPAIARICQDGSTANSGPNCKHICPEDLSSSTPTPDETANWKMYTNATYSLQLKYPERFSLKENSKLEEFYDNLATLTSSSNEKITVKVIHDVDVYKNEKPEKVAFREIMDSGLKYDITTTIIGDYSAAITSFNNVVNSKKSPIITIAHPSKNLFIVIDFNNTDLSRVEFELFLSTFKFISAEENCDALKGQQDSRDFVKGELLIGFNDNISLNEAQGVIRGLGLSIKDDRAFANLKMLEVKVAEGEEFKWICVLRKNQQIKYAEINQKIQIPDCSKGPC